jgi:hypothetical protein
VFFFFDRYLFENKLNKNKKMKNIVKLTESDLTRLVKRVIEETVQSGEVRDKNGNIVFSYDCVKSTLTAGGRTFSTDPQFCNRNKSVIS